MSGTRVAMAAVLLSAAILAGCSEQAATEVFPYGQKMPLQGQAVPFHIFTHCGVERVQIGGLKWIASDLAADLRGPTAPRGWDEWQVGELTLRSGSEAVFKTNNDVITYRPADDQGQEWTCA